MNIITFSCKPIVNYYYLKHYTVLYQMKLRLHNVSINTNKPNILFSTFILLKGDPYLSKPYRTKYGNL